jgi:hypothetical protein
MAKIVVETPGVPSGVSTRPVDLVGGAASGLERAEEQSSEQRRIRQPTTIAATALFGPPLETGVHDPCAT